MLFSISVLSRIVSIARGLVRGQGVEGRWGLVGSHRLIQSMEWAKTAIGSSQVPHPDSLMPLRAEKCILIVKQHQQKPSVKEDLALYGQVLGVSW